MRIIPAIDIIEGKCVRLSQGDYSKKIIYNEDPIEVAKSFEGAGIQYLHLVDLDGAKSKTIVNWKVLEGIKSQTNLSVDFGGGIKQQKDLEIAFNSGANQITAGSIAIQNPDLVKEWMDVFGAEKIILGADVKDEKIAIQGWTEVSNIEIQGFIESFMANGLKSVISTDISKDGMLEGPSIELYQKLIEWFPRLDIIASGGVSCLKDLELLKELGVFGTIVGKAIYEGKISLKELSKLC